MGELFSYPEPVPPDLLQQVAKPTKLIAHVFFLMQMLTNLHTMERMKNDLVKLERCVVLDKLRERL